MRLFQKVMDGVYEIIGSLYFLTGFWGVVLQKNIWLSLLSIAIAFGIPIYRGIE